MMASSVDCGMGNGPAAHCSVRSLLAVWCQPLRLPPARGVDAAPLIMLAAPLLGCCRAEASTRAEAARCRRSAWCGRVGELPGCGHRSRLSRAPVVVRPSALLS